MDAGDNGTSILVVLNGDAVASINAAVGGFWAVGGEVTTLVDNPIQAIFAYSSDPMSRRLILDLGGTVFWDDFETGTTERWTESRIVQAH